MPNYIYTYSTYILIIFLCIFVRHGFNDQHDQPLQKLMQARKLESLLKVSHWILRVQNGKQSAAQTGSGGYSLQTQASKAKCDEYIEPFSECSGCTLVKHGKVRLP